MRNPLLLSCLLCLVACNNSDAVQYPGAIERGRFECQSHGGLRHVLVTEWDRKLALKIRCSDNTWIETTMATKEP